MKFFGRHFYTSSMTMVSPNGQYELFIMAFFGRIHAGHLTEVATGEVTCMKPAEIKFFLQAQGEQANGTSQT